MSEFTDRVLMHLVTCQQCQNTMQLAISVIDKHVKKTETEKKDNG